MTGRTRYGYVPYDRNGDSEHAVADDTLPRGSENVSYTPAPCGYAPLTTRPTL